MRSANSWFKEYGESHQNPTNKALHWVCVPLIFWSVLALLWEIPIPSTFADLPFLLNWAILATVAASMWYLFLSLTLASGVLIFSALCLSIAWLLDTQAGWSLWLIALAVFVLAWIGQFIGHQIEGKKPSFFKDIQFLLIGPAWLLGFVYRRLGIPY